MWARAPRLAHTCVHVQSDEVPHGSQHCGTAGQIDFVPLVSLARYLSQQREKLTVTNGVIHSGSDNKRALAIIYSKPLSNLRNPCQILHT